MKVKDIITKTDELGRIKRAQGDMIEQVKDQKNLK